MKKTDQFRGIHLSSILFWIFLFSFIILKWEYLELGYFWDEAWVYAKSVNYFIENGIRILPSEEGMDFTRGHPMLFHFLTASWGKIVSSTVFSMHVLMMCISLATLVFIHLFISKITSRFASVIITAYLLGNEIFFVQSSLLLPEVLLGFLCLATIYYLVAKNYVGYFVSLALALLTKESAIVLVPLVLFYLLYEILSDKYFDKKLIGVTLIAMLVASIHFIYQKVYFGWFFYPYHLDFVDLSLKSINERYSGFFQILFAWNYQYLVSGLLLLSLAGLSFPNILNKDFAIRKLLFPALSLFVACLSYLFSMPFLFIGNLLMLTIFLMLLQLNFETDNLKKLVVSSWVFVYGYLMFCALNFYTIRYLVPLIILFAVVFGVLLYEFCKKFKISAYVLALILLIVLIIMRNQNRELRDIDTAYKYAIRTHIQISEYMEQRVEYETPIITGFLEGVILGDSDMGYLEKENAYENINKDYGGAQYYIISNLETNIENARKSVNLEKWELEKQFRNKMSIGEIYRRK